ncbi:hypothetical protein [Rickettsiales endosymbiont of Trichoplax sp. H2]|uniref:hypothetical protein n=1 Tax=Rickettsiales endosymbiont of Trichoplax sp. H2 TaxID=2021221 RepID=UPI0012B22E77|nr:hypothetical protein [Rickettsiales endosymbiont of Trichoplax sp. H2]MSO13938.1 hypothetical protein [Rickettsiales endosymbiont of Trichoplax sp. H2]
MNNKIKKRHVICIKWGDRYSSDYVNKLFLMVDRNITLSYQFHCLTDSDKGIDSRINILKIPKNEVHLWGWWQKISIFKEVFFGLQGDLLFIDLDMLILNNIDDFFLYEQGKLCVTENYYNDKWISSCVMRVTIGSNPKIWSDFWENSDEICERLKKRGDQAYIKEAAENYVFWPNNWVLYYKNHCKYRLLPINLGLPTKVLSYISKIANLYANEPVDGKILAFQGKPNIHEIAEYPISKYRAAPWIKKYWK